MIDLIEIKGWFHALASLRDNWRLILAKGWRWVAKTVILLPAILWHVLMVFSREPAALVVSGLAVAVAFGAGDFSRHRTDATRIANLKMERNAAQVSLATTRASYVAEAAKMSADLADLKREKTALLSEVATLKKAVNDHMSKPAPASVRSAAPRRTVQKAEPPAPTWKPF